MEDEHRFQGKELEFVNLLLADAAKRKAAAPKAAAPPQAPKISGDKIANAVNELEHEEQMRKWQEAMSGNSSSPHAHDGNCPPGCSGDHSAERAIFEKSTSEKLRAVRLLKDEGNELFRTSEFAQATIAYRRGLVFLDYTFPDTPDEEREFKLLEIALCLNLAAAKEKQHQYTEALSFAQRASNKDTENPKAWFRLGTIQLAMDEFTPAHEALTKALSLAPGDIAILSALRKLAERKSEYAAKSKAMAQRIVN